MPHTASVSLLLSAWLKKGDGSLLLANASGFDGLQPCLDVLVLSRVVWFTIFSTVRMRG